MSQSPSPAASGPFAGGGLHHAANKAEARLCLLAVAFLYGTLNVALKQLYSSENPPTAAALSCIRGWMVALCFMVPNVLFPRRRLSSGTGTGKRAGLMLSAFELAVWNCGAFALLNLGIVMGESTTRASFLTQTSVVITPLLSILAGQVVDRQTLAGCVVALGGLVVLSSAQHGAGEGDPHDLVADMAGEVVPEHHAHFHTNTRSASSADTVESFPPSLVVILSASDLLVLGGAACWSLYLVRMSSLAPRYDRLQLQGAMTAIRALMYTIWVLVATFSVRKAAVEATWLEALQDLWPGWCSSLLSWVLLAFSAIGPGALASILQQRGQRAVSAGETNVLLSAEPVFTALCAWAVLGEVTTTQERFGGAIIAAAALLASGSFNSIWQRMKCGGTQWQKKKSD